MRWRIYLPVLILCFLTNLPNFRFLCSFSILRSALGFCRRSSPAKVVFELCLSAPPRRRLFVVFFFFVRRALVQLVAPRQTCLRCWSVGVLLRNYKPCADSLKVNKFPFCLSAQCLQLRCPPTLYICSVCSRLLPPFETPRIRGVRGIRGVRVVRGFRV